MIHISGMPVTIIEMPKRLARLFARPAVIDDPVLITG